MLVLFAASSAWTAPANFSDTAARRIGPYLLPEAQEIALARSAAPPAISAHATILILKSRGYAAVIKGSNGFVCLVARSWDNATNVKSARFWNPTFRAPYCFNPAGARTVLTRYLGRTRWVAAGASRRLIGARTEAAWAAGRFKAPQAGAMAYMMSGEGRGIGGKPGPWRPHLMFYFPRARAPHWGANLPGNPVFATAGKHTAVLYVLVPVWSDGSPAPAFR